MSSSSICLNDGSFGPGVQGCRGDFDFTQKFERIFFSILPTAIFLAAASVRVTLLSQEARIVGGRALQYLKLAVTVVFSIIQLTLLILSATGAPDVVRNLSITASSLAFAASLLTVALSFAEHSRARRPSTLLCIYIFLTLIFDAVQARTAWLSVTSHDQTTPARLFTSSLALKFVMLCLEAVPKTRWIQWDAGEHSPEESSSVFSLGAYYWLNRLFLRGYRGVLVIDDLYPLDTAMTSPNLYAKLAKNIRVHQYRNEPKLGLCKDLFRALTGPFLSPIAPRTALIGFKFCQPFFISSMLEYLQKPEDASTGKFGHGLIGACVLIYLGIAFSSALYNYYNQKAVYMIRGCLSAAIYRKTTQTKLTAADDAAAVTLMSTDLERIIRGSIPVHEVWANTIEVAIGSWLLQRQLGLAFLSPIILIIGCACILAWVLTIVGKRQSNWMEKIQNRVGLTSNAISNMKLYKISGITGPVADLIQRLRVEEIKTGNGFRWLALFAAVLGFTPISLSPVVTFAVTSQHLNVNSLFTSLSYIILLSNPLISMFQNLPAIFAALTCMQRVQKFLSDEPRIDFRKQRGRATLAAGSKDTDAGDALPAFTIENGDFGWGGEKMTLSRINTSIPAGRLTLVVGQVASGKSTFCKVLLGEVPVAVGTVTAFLPPSQIGYCEQTPFLYNTTLKKNIIGHYEFDQKKYDEIVEATMLAPDVLLLPDGDNTNIGSDGIMLSGGQKQRVSVARALYSESDVMIFDDVLSGLDNDTEAELFRRCFGPGGMTSRRNTTVVICTHSIRHLPTANHIIALGADGTIIEQGSFEDLMQNNKYVQSLGVKQAIETKRSHAEEPPAPCKTAAAPKPPPPNGFKSALEDKARQQGDWSTYKHYFRSTGVFPALLMVAGAVMYAACNNLSTVWLKFWSEDSFGRPVGFYLGVFGMLLVLKVVFIFVTGTSTFILMISSSGNILHKRAITTVVTAPLKFFTTTDSGTVTNLFSQDMTILDGELPESLTNLALDFADCIGMAFVIASASPYLAIGYPFLFVVLYFVQRFYLRTSRQLRLLDLESKSPLYTHFLDTIKGVATIRAFGWEVHDIEHNNKLLDTSQRPVYLLAMIQQWLITGLQLIVTAIAVFLTSLATQLRVNTGLTGASLVTLLTFSETVSTLIQSYTLLETSLGAVSRLTTFSETVRPEDQPGEDLEPAQDWPRGGFIEFDKVSASYDTNTDGSSAPPNLVIRDLTLSIRAGEKVAICGRTGSGKSTLMMLLLRLLDPLPSSSGGCSMSIDGTRLDRIDRAALRRRIIAIPQDAVFLPDGSTIRANMDPLGTATPRECRDALAAVGLAHFADDRGGLDARMGADDLSAGQRQLFSLGRAILRRRIRERVTTAAAAAATAKSDDDKGRGGGGGGVLLLDEVSSSVDRATDRKMQKIIRDEFESFTIIMVSHRLEMVVDFFDRVVVLDKGTLVESGSPRKLIETPGSRFGDLWAIENHDSGDSEHDDDDDDDMIA